MRILGTIRGYDYAAYDDVDTEEPAGLVAMGRNIVEGVTTYRTSDSSNDIRRRLVLRSFAPSLTSRELGRVMVYTQYMDTTDTPPEDAIPYPADTFPIVNLVKLDERRLLVIWWHGVATYSDTSVSSTQWGTAFVVTCADDGSLTRGSFTEISAPVIGGTTYTPNLYTAGPMATKVGENNVTCFVTCLVQPGGGATTGDAVCSTSLQVDGSVVTVGAWSVAVETTRATGVGRPIADGAFEVSGAAYASVQNAPYADGSYGPAIYSTGGASWEAAKAQPSGAKDWQYFLRANHLPSGKVYLLANAMFDDGSANWHGVIVAQFDGTTFTRLRDQVMNVPVHDGDHYGHPGEVLEFSGGLDWGRSEVDLISPKGDMLIWQAFGWAWIGLVGPTGDNAQAIDLWDVLPSDATQQGGTRSGITMVVTGRNAIVQLYYWPDTGGQLSAVYFLVELVSPARMGPRVQGAHFSRGS